mmetsp:Transcript_50255/g.106782  ORF Transcript_50255/g.106782 Transcript_50255/m.106782 type:complete len:792 (+) Transcript_50255:42-2417(+)
MADDEERPQGVLVCVRVRPMFTKRPDGTPAREAACQRIVEMDGEAASGCGSAVTKIFNPQDMSAKPREFAFDRSYWSSDGFKEDPERPGFNIPDGPNSKYVSQDMVWDDVGQLVMRNALQGYNCTVFAYGQSGAGKSYSVVGYPPNLGIIPNTLTFLFSMIEENKDPDVRYQVEIAMLEVYMDEVYDLLAPRGAERQKLKVFVNNNQVMIYDPSDRKNPDKIWRAARNQETAEQFRLMGDANRSVRATGMNPSSSRGHTVFMCRFTKATKNGAAWVEDFKSKISLVDLAGSERAHDTGLTGIGLKEGIAINQSLTYLGQVLASLCKSERVNYRDKLTQLLAESLNGQAVTVMIAAISPADINFEDTLSTLRFADNAKKMPVKIKKQISPTQQLIADLKEENAKLQADLAKLSQPEGLAAAQANVEDLKNRLASADKELADLEPEYEALNKQLEEAAAEAKKAAIRKEMDEKYEKIEALNNDRSQIVHDLDEAKEMLGSGLREKQQAILALLEISEEENQWEQKLAKADQDEQKLKESFKEKGVSVNEILGLMNAGTGDSSSRKAPRYFVNLCEDSHENGLLFFIPDGDSKIKRFVPNDDEPGIKLPGDSVESHHATVHNDPAMGKISITSGSETAQLWVNGAKVVYGTEGIELTHGARVIIGLEFVFRYVDPDGKSEKKLQLDENGVPIVVDIGYALQELEVKAGRSQASAVERGRKTLVGRQRQRKEARKSLMKRATQVAMQEDEITAELRRLKAEEQAQRKQEIAEKRKKGKCAGKLRVGNQDKDCKQS